MLDFFDMPLWHGIAILSVFVLGFFAGRYSIKMYYYAKIEELENRVLKNQRDIEYHARRL
tara:strand:+ start:543 stop:722 length:180 start_codon:yes stop_codon:yes gene_type:complete